MHGAPHLQPMNRIVVREPVNQPLKGMGLLERMLQTRDEPAAVFFLCLVQCLNLGSKLLFAFRTRTSLLFSGEPDLLQRV